MTNFSDNDSAFGDEPFFWNTDPMFSSLAAPLAGSKRNLENEDAQIQSGLTDQKGPQVEHFIDACCTHCPEPCDESCGRPSKRRASPNRVGEFHSLTTEPHASFDTDHQFPDDCFEKFCEECSLEPSRAPECAVSCPGDSSCTSDDACFDPSCNQRGQHCSDGCVDPDCTKLSCPLEPCFCQKCDTQSCPLGDLNNECHSAHSAPTQTGTVYCYDNAPCHFQEGYHGTNDGLSSFETYPCFSQTHTYMAENNNTGQTSSAPTPMLSPSNYTSLESAFTSEPSPAPRQPSFSNCYLNVSSDHCHIDNACCHGPKRACGDHPSAPQSHLDMWSSSIAQDNSLANRFMNFGMNSSHPTSPVSPNHPPMSSSLFNNTLNGSMLGFNDQSWTLQDSSFSNTFQFNALGMNKLDFLATALQQEFMNPAFSLANTPSVDPGPVSGTASFAGTPADPQNCTCKWQHAPGLLCLAIFDSAEALHKHMKAAHVDNCTRCFCQWEGCEASSKDFKQRSKLSRHLLGHAGYRPYACSYEGCDKTFATNQAKDNHERTHTGERPYVCNRCGYTTTTHTQLQTHVSALHEGKKPHKCRFCEFTCADSSNLSKHERTHQTLRPYRCPHPNCTFKPDCRWENLKRHLRRSRHCPQLLFDDSKEYKMYRESVRHEIDDWHKRNEDSGTSKLGRRKGRS